MERRYDAVVIGGGHAGAEAAHALAKLNCKTLLVTLSLEAITFLACNPNIGGTAKGHLVKEIDALGGIMPVIADRATIQTRLLNRGNGPAVHSLRAQVDKNLYHRAMKGYLEELENLTILESEVKELIVENGAVCGVRTTTGDYSTNVAVIATGVYLDSRILTGEYVRATGPAGFMRSVGFSDYLKSCGISVRRFKTGTPPRVLARTVDFSEMEPQAGESDAPRFSVLTDEPVRNDKLCYLTYTNAETHRAIFENLDRAPLYNGSISGTGPRYCPSIEDKVVRFKDKERHQVFIEPEGADTSELYVQGLSTSLPFDVQERMVHSLPGLRKAHITRYGYAIEYDCIDPMELTPTLELKKIKNVFSAGQMNGSSGYEEAAAQGLMAGINAARSLKGESGVVLRRDQAYIGVLIDDLVTKGTNEPYRMMTSRAEHRLYLRQDNADLRLCKIGKEIGLLDETRCARFERKMRETEELREVLHKGYSPEKVEAVFEKAGEPIPKGGITGTEILKRAKLNRFDLTEIDSEYGKYSDESLSYIEVELKYEGYLKKEARAVQEAMRLEEKALPADWDYMALDGLRIEARQKLNKVRPQTLAQASRISGVTPADISVLMIYLQRGGKRSAVKHFLVKQE